MACIGRTSSLNQDPSHVEEILEMRMMIPRFDPGSCFRADDDNPLREGRLLPAVVHLAAKPSLHSPEISAANNTNLRSDGDSEERSGNRRLGFREVKVSIYILLRMI